MLRTVHLLGEMGDKYGSEHRLDVTSVGEALRALDTNFKGFLQDIKKDEYYNVCVGDFDEKHALNDVTIGMKYKTGDIWIAPEIIGKKNSSITTVIVGIVMVVVGAVLTYYGMGAVGVPMMKMGAAFIIGGMISLITTVTPPDYDSQEDPDERASFIFDGPINTNEQGGAIPICYGEVLIGSCIVSTSLEIEQIPYVAPVEEVIPPADPPEPHDSR